MKRLGLILLLLPIIALSDTIRVLDDNRDSLAENKFNKVIKTLRSELQKPSHELALSVKLQTADEAQPQDVARKEKAFDRVVTASLQRAGVLLETPEVPNEKMEFLLDDHE